jgi:Bacterial Ig domain/IPT/TIG domain
MRLNSLKAIAKTAVLGAAVLLLGMGAASAQVTVNLSAGSTSATLPDGTSVPMWGYTCTTANDPNCRALNPNANGSWSPVVITVPTGQALTINLTNNLLFNGNNIPTSLVVVGQLGGGIGTPGGFTDSPDHTSAQTVTWPIADPTTSGTAPTQGQRVRSFGTEVAAVPVGSATAPTALTWANLKPGTYLIESGTHPSIQGPMGLYGILVVTTAPGAAAGTAYPGVAYSAEVPLLLSEIDAAQNNEVSTAVGTAGFGETQVWTRHNSGGPVTSIAVTNGGTGYTAPPVVQINGSGSGATAAATVTGGLVTSIQITNAGDGYSSAAGTTTVTITAANGDITGAGATATATVTMGGCGGGAHTCYPPAVDYAPLYYLINGVAFNKTSASSSLFATSPATGVTGNVLVRLVNAGLRMHVPSIVGAQTGTPATPGFSLIAEDGNPLPGLARVQTEVFMAAGKTYDVMVNVPAAGYALPVFDRELSLSGNAVGRDTGMFGYIGVNGALPPAASGLGPALAVNDTYSSLVPGKTLTVSDPAKGLIANDTNVYGVQVLTGPTGGTLVLDPKGTFTYTPNTGTTADSFTYCANGGAPPAACPSNLTATVTLGAATADAAAGITCTSPLKFSSNSANFISVQTPGLLATCKDAAGYPLTVDTTPANIVASGVNVIAAANGGFTATTTSATTTAASTASFTFIVKSSYGVSSAPVTANISFAAGSGLKVTVLDGNDKKTQISDYRWVIEEDRTFYVDPNCTTNPPPAACQTATSTTGNLLVPTFGTNFHTSYMPVVATGCTGPLSCESGQTLLGQAAVCDVGNGVCRTTAIQEAAVDPSQVALDPTKRYYLTVLPGDAANPFEAAGNGHGMGGAPIPFACPPTSPSGVVPTCPTLPALPTWAPLTVLTQPTPLQTAKLSVFVFEDDFPLNGENDAGGQVADNQLGTQEPGLGGFNITLFDDAGGTGDATGQMTYDMFNMPLSNSLDGTIDPATNLNACPIAKAAPPGSDPTLGPVSGITGTIVTCPKYESDGVTQSPLAGQAVVANMMPGRYGVVATPGADRIGRGEEWLQTNTLDGQKAHDSFLRVGEPSFFQEYGPASYHVVIGFANPKIINDRKAAICNGGDPNFGLVGTNCTNKITGIVTTERMSRTPDERLYSSGDNSSFGFTQCYISFGDADGEDFAFTKCNADGSFTLSGLPDGDWRVTVFDQWNDMLVDGLSTPVRLAGGATTNLGQIATNQWQANIYTSTFFDANKNGVRDGGEAGLSLVATNIRFRDGSYSNFNNTDLQGNAGFNEVFPLFSWYVIETDSTRYKNTGIHVVYDAGGPADGTCTATTAQCGTSNIAASMANSYEAVPLPANLHVPGALYCDNGDCSAARTAAGVYNTTARVDPPWVASEGWQGFSGQNSFLEFGKAPFAVGENGGIHGEVIYASTRPFDDPALLIHTSWTPDVPNVTINLYKENTAPDGSTSLTLFDTTKTSSFDDWAQGFHTAPDGTAIPNMNCPGQGRNTGANADLFFFSLFDQPNYLDLYNSYHGGPAITQLPLDAQFKCYDGMHNWNQLQPAPYDGMYSFPSVTSMDPSTGKPTGTNCARCTTNPDATDSFRFGTPMLPAGKYVVEVVVPPGYELVKEEDKNILIGDNYIAPVAQQFGGLSNIFILPDQAEVGAAYNANNPGMPNTDQGRTTLPSTESDTGSVEQLWPCVGEARVVPDYISLFPQSQEVAPFAGATRPLCDRKEVTVADQAAALAKFWVFTSAHTAAHFTGVITDDFTSEFDPFSPTFGEKFAPPDMPISIKDWAGNEISRIYSDHWGAYDGLTYSTWEVNPPNPTGYAPQMMVTCMNDPGTGPTPDALYNPQYSNFCYEIPFMPGQTQYMDTPVTPTSAFAGAGYNNPDCAYPANTPAISEVDGDGVGPWVSASGHTLTIQALGDQLVPNNAYSGPSATTAPYNQKTITRHYGFGATAGTVTIGTHVVSGQTVPDPATITSWSDSTITVTVPADVAACPLQQQLQYGGSTAQCGELVITAANGKQSIDSVTVTIGGKAPTHVSASASVQAAIDAARPGDMLMIDPTCNAAGSPVACTTAGATHSNSVHSELLLMWKPVRLQGVGGASSIIDGNTHPAGKLDPWRLKVNCLFGLGPAGTHNTWSAGCATALFGSSVFGFTATPTNPQIDRVPLEAVVGWDATLNGNLAQLLQEPTLMGALEGAAITVLGKGVRFPSDPFVADTFPVGTLLLLGTTNATRGCGLNTAAAHNPFPSNFLCNPSSIDGLGVRNSSQGGGGIFLHAWAHNMQIANNRVANNSGTLSGGINVGQGEFPPAYLGGFGAVNAAPGSCQASGVTGLQLPYCQELNVNVHHNSITSNSSTGDELFSATPAGAGGISFCTGSDFYKFQYNWVCGNLSTGDGGGVGHLGFSYNGDIEHNTIIFNQSTNPTIQANGGGMIVMGSPDADPVCSAVADTDCLVAPGAVPPSDGVGPLLTINANLIMGNTAESGSGGGIAFQNVNGSDVVSFPTQPTRWNHVVLTNNIITNNVAGWDGAGISLLDALNTDIINNTIASNDTTASSGVLFNTLGAPLASAIGPCTVDPATGAIPANCVTTSTAQPAGLVSIQNSAILKANLPASITCPVGHFATTASNGTCRTVSYPLLDNNVLWQNRAFYIGVGALGGGTLNQQNIVTLYDGFTTTAAPSQPSAGATTANGNGSIITGGTGACPSPVSYWDIGVRGDTGPTNHASTVTLNPTYSVMTNTTGYNANNTAANPTLLLQYCNGSRIPPEFGGTGYQVPPGIADATVPNPVFSLTPAATVDEGNNWINMSWGPLSLSNPVTSEGLSNYGPAAGSSVINLISSLTALANYTAAPATDFYGNPRKGNGEVDAGAVEFLSTVAAPTLTSISPASGLRGATVNVTLTGANLTGAFLITVSGTGVPVSNLTVVSDTTVTATFTIANLATLGARTVRVSTPGGVSNPVTFTVTAPPPPTLTSITPTSGVRGTSVTVTFNGTNLTGAFAVTGIGALIPVTNITVVSANQVTAILNITRAAPLGIRNLGITTPGGTSNTLPFTVTGGTAAFTGPAPALTTTPANGTTKTGTVTLRNSATVNAGPITLTAAPVVNRVTGTGAFTVTGGTCASGTVLAPAATCTIVVQYVPPTTGSLTSTAHVTISDTGVATATQNSPNFTAN